MTSHFRRIVSDIRRLSIRIINSYNECDVPFLFCAFFFQWWSGHTHNGNVLLEHRVMAGSYTSTPEWVVHMNNRGMMKRYRDILYIYMGMVGNIHRYLFYSKNSCNMKRLGESSHNHIHIEHILDTSMGTV